MPKAKLPLKERMIEILTEATPECGISDLYELEDNESVDCIISMTAAEWKAFEEHRQ